MNKHTPGPWTWYAGPIHEPYDDGTQEAHDPVSWVCTGYVGNPCLVAANGAVVVDAGNGEYSPCNEADGTLIAAAPDLLAALEAIAARVDGVFDDPALMAFGPLSIDTEADCLAIARAAIAKARGE